jgi:hypothetical protein
VQIKGNGFFHLEEEDEGRIHGSIRWPGSADKNDAGG